VSIDDFAKLDLRIGKVLECGFVEGSDKLLRFQLDAGELGQRQIFSGIRASYGEPESWSAAAWCSSPTSPRARCASA
jgi:methionyl-tRNA synthetase